MTGYAIHQLPLRQEGQLRRIEMRQQGKIFRKLYSPELQSQLPLHRTCQPANDNGGRRVHLSDILCSFASISAGQVRPTQFRVRAKIPHGVGITPPQRLRVM
jgi:hypothetical protein